MTARGCLWHRRSPLKRSTGRLSRQPAEPELQQETDGRIDRSEVRDTPWDPLARKGRWRVWNSRRGKPSWPAVTNRINRPDIWMQAIRSDQKNSCGTGAVHIWVPAFAGTTAVGYQRPVA